MIGDGDHNMDTAGICTGNLVNGVCSFATSVGTKGGVLGTWG